MNLEVLGTNTGWGRGRGKSLVGPLVAHTQPGQWAVRLVVLLVNDWSVLAAMVGWWGGVVMMVLLLLVCLCACACACGLVGVSGVRQGRAGIFLPIGRAVQHSALPNALLTSPSLFVPACLLRNDKTPLQQTCTPSRCPQLSREIGNGTATTATTTTTTSSFALHNIFFRRSSTPPMMRGDDTKGPHPPMSSAVPWSLLTLAAQGLPPPLRASSIVDPDFALPLPRLVLP